MISPFSHFFFHFLCFISYATRPDLDSAQGIMPLFDSLLGTTCIANTQSETILCPEDTYAYGFKLLYYIDYGIINIVIECRKPIYDSDISQWTTQDSQTISFSNIGAVFSSWSLSESEMIYCSCNNGKYFFRGCEVKTWCPETLADAQGIVEVRMWDCDSALQPESPKTDHIDANIGSTFCNAGFAACGYTMEVFHQQSNDRKYGAAGLKLECCRICDISEGFFFNSLTKKCEYCDIVCQECSGSATNCIKCYSGYTLNEVNMCVSSVRPITLAQEFFTLPFIISGWTINSGSIAKKIYGDYAIIGDQSNLFTNGKFIEKTFSSIPSHEIAIIFVQVFKFYNWIDGGLQIFVDGIIQTTISLADMQYPLFYSGFFQSSKKVLFVSHNVDTMKIKFLPTYTGGGFWAINRFQVLLLSCDTTCLTCSGASANQCTSCNIGSFLQSPAPAACLSTCPIGKFADSSDNTCKNCDISCLECTKAGISGCTVCSTNLYLQIAVGPTSCLSTCPPGSFKNEIPQKTCLACHSSCLTCSGALNSDCLSCYSGNFLASIAPSSCVFACQNGKFYNSLSDTCEICDISCETCSKVGINGCESCINGTFLQREIGPSSCKDSCSSGYYPDNLRNVCAKCDSSCLECSGVGSNNCTACFNGKFLSEISMSGICSDKCNVGYYGDNLTNMCLKCDDSCNECLISGEYGCTDCRKNYYFAENETYFAGNKIGRCLEKEKVTPVLTSSKNSLRYKIIFNKNYSKVYQLYKQFTSIWIEGISNSLYNFSISNEGAENDVFIISLLNVSFSITNSFLYVNLNPSEDILENSTIQLTTYNLSIKMKYYYYLDKSTADTINLTKALTNNVNNLVSSTFFAANLLSYSLISGMIALISIEEIRFLRYFEVRYPENVIVTFQAAPPTPDIIPNIEIEEDGSDGSLPEVFQMYGTSVYLFNNNGNMFIEVMVAWMFGVVALLLANRFKNTKKNYVKITIIIISVIFAWNYALSFFLSNYVTFAFYTFLFYKFQPNNNYKTYCNLAYSLIIGVLDAIIFPFVFIKISRIRQQNLLKIIPIEEEHKKNMQDNEEINSGNKNLIGKVCSTKEQENIKKIKMPTTFKKMLSSEMDNNMINFIQKKMTIFRNSNEPDFQDEQSSKRIMDLDGSSTIMKTPTLNHHGSKINRTFMKTEASRYGILHKEFNQNTKINSYFLVFNLMKQLIYSMILCIFYSMPFEGLTMTLVIKTLYLIIFIFFNPFKSRKEFVFNFISEISGCAAIGCSLYIAYMDKNEIMDEPLKINIGWGIVLANLLLGLLFLLRTVAELIGIIYILLKDVYRVCRKKLKRNKVHDQNSELKKGKFNKGIFNKIIEMENFLP